MCFSPVSFSFVKRMARLKTLVACGLALFFVAGSLWAEDGLRNATPGQTVSATTTPPITKGQRLFAAHHSYFLPVPQILTEIAKAAGYADQTWVGTKYIGGSKSLYHWNLKDEDNKAKQALNEGAVDVLILTPVY